MTRKQLNKLLTMRMELRELERIRASFASIGPKARPVSDTPRARKLCDSVGNLTVEMIELDQRIDDLKERVAKREADAEAFMNQIPDVSVRMVFRLRFLRGLTWGEVAEAFGGNNTAESVRKMYSRYFDGGP